MLVVGRKLLAWGHPALSALVDAFEMLPDKDTYLSIRCVARGAEGVADALASGASPAKGLVETPHGPRWVQGAVRACAMDVLGITREGLVLGAHGDDVFYRRLYDVAHGLEGYTNGRDWHPPRDFGHFEVSRWKEYPFAGSWPPGAILR